jgi:hypothetical protein
LPTYVTEHARRHDLVRPVIAEIGGSSPDQPVTVVGGSHRLQLGQLRGTGTARRSYLDDGTPDRVLCSWVVRGPAGATVTVTAAHDRSGRDERRVTLGAEATVSAVARAGA